MDIIDEFPTLALDGWTCRFPSSFIARTYTRELLEGTERRLTGHTNMGFLEDH